MNNLSILSMNGVPAISPDKSSITPPDDSHTTMPGDIQLGESTSTPSPVSTLSPASTPLPALPIKHSDLSTWVKNNLDSFMAEKIDDDIQKGLWKNLLSYWMSLEHAFEFKSPVGTCCMFLVLFLLICIVAPLS